MVSASTVMMLITQNDSPVPTHDQIFENIAQCRTVSPQQKTGSGPTFLREFEIQGLCTVSSRARTEVGAMPRYLLTCLQQPLPQAVFIFVNHVFPRTRHRSCLSRPIKISVSFASPSAWLHLPCSLILTSGVIRAVETSPCASHPGRLMTLL